MPLPVSSASPSANRSRLLPPGATSCHPAPPPATRRHLLPPNATSCRPASLPATRHRLLLPATASCCPAPLLTARRCHHCRHRQEQWPPPSIASLAAMSDDDDKIMTANIAYKAPPFCIQDPSIWFSILECNFKASRITTSLAKFSNSSALLPPNVLSQVSDVIGNAVTSSTPYEDLKTAILIRLESSKASFQKNAWQWEAFKPATKYEETIRKQIHVFRPRNF